MFLTTAFALAAASLAMAQGISLEPTSLTQCAQSTFGIDGAASPYYVAVLPATDPCTSDALAEYYDVTTPSVNYYTNLPSGTQVQLYVLDANNQEYWGPIMTVGNGDSSCLGGSDAATAADFSSSSSSSSSDSSTDPSTTASSTSSTSTNYVAPTNNAANTGSGSTYTPSSSSGSVADNSSGDNGDGNAPANAADSANTTTTTGGASTITASTTLLVGAFAAAIALF